MLYREIIAVCSQIHIKHINTLCGLNAELLNVKLVAHIRGTRHWDLHDSAVRGSSSLKHQHDRQLFNYSLLIVTCSLKITVLIY